jgi:membrane protein implicated in regulation of membrane protease activity
MTLTALWLIIGIALCLMELLIPTAFLESALGVSAFFVALLSGIVRPLAWQIALWMVFSLILFGVLRRLVPKKGSSTLQAAVDARTLTAIIPGETGRVIYEGCSWQARCSDETVAIAANQTVFVIGRQGNTLIVLPQSTLESA